MKYLASLLLLGLALPGLGATSIVPAPKQIQLTESQALPLSQGSVAIVIGDRASEPEKYAASTLQSSVRTRFGPTWAICRESDNLNGHKVLILLGRRDTNAFLDGLCREWGLDLSEQSPGHDGYVIEMRQKGGQEIVLVGGSDPRGVIYGQDALFQLVKDANGGLALTRASVRDRPSIPWRGKPQTSVELHLQEGIMDWYLRSRMNFTDLRNGTYAFEAGDELNAELITRAVTEAHRRGMIVYASVNCGVDRARHDAVLKMFERFIPLNVDGLWLSFDDKGAGEAPEALVARVIELGKKHGMTGHLIATTPPGGAYQVILSDFNRRIAAVPGMEDALWFFTCIPSAEALEAARSIGLKSDPGWWHNWPRVPGHGMVGRTAYAYGFLAGSGYNRRDDKRAYLPVPTLEEGWHQPTYDVLSGAGDWTDAIMQWGGSAWKWEYTYTVLSWWGWSPEKHDWNAVRRRIYELVFRPESADAAKVFDDGLRSLRKLFRFATAENGAEVVCPMRLMDTADRPKAREILAGMETAFRKLETATPGFVDPQRFNDYYIDPMRAELATAKAATEVPYSEYWWEGHQRALLDAIYSGDLDEAKRLIDGVRARVLSEVNEVKSKLTEMDGLDAYVKWWTDRANLDVDGWKKLLEDRKAGFVQCTDTLEDRKFGDPRKKWIKNLSAPPEDFKVVATVLPNDRQQFAGAWFGGLNRKYGQDLYIFAYPLKHWTRMGEYCETEIVVPVSGRRGWRGVQFFLNAWTNETIADEYMKGRYLGRRFIQLLCGDEVLWQEDVSLPRGEGEWVTVGLPEADEGTTEIKLRLRVEDREESYNYAAAIFVGPMNAVMVPR